MTEQSRELGNPEPGLFKIRMVRGGIDVAARISRLCHCTVNGGGGNLAHEWAESCDRYPPLTAEINGRDRPGMKYVWWVWTGGRFIGRKTYDYLLADAKWCRDYAPTEPRAKPWRAVDINRTAPRI